MKKISILLLTFFMTSAVHAKGFSVLTWNLLLLPGIIKTTFHDARLPLIAKKLSAGSYDFIFLQEVFTGAGFDSISKALKAKGYYSTGYPNRDFFKPVNSGVVIFSKFPLSEIKSVPLKGLIGADYFSSKAIISAKAKISETLSIQLVNTHLQAKENEESALVRKLQLTQLEEGFNKVDPKLKLPIIFAGDFNIDRNIEAESLYLKNFLTKYNFKTALPQTEIKNTVSCQTNILKSYIDANCTYIKYLDYIYANNSAKVEDLKILEIKDSYVMEGKAREFPLSDHYAVEATIII